MELINNTIRIPTPEIFSFAECLHFLDRGYDDCLYSIESDRVLKPLRIDNNQVLMQVKEEAGALETEILSGEVSELALETAAAFVTEWFDLHRDLQPFYRRLGDHQHLSWMADRFYGLRLMGIPDLFEALCWCVIGQQINLTFAHRLKRQLVETYGTFIVYQERPYYYFPEPEQLSRLTVSDLKELQFSRQKAEYIIGIAQEFAEGRLTKNGLSGHDGGQMMKRLLQIRGVGEWTANYVLMKSLKKMDCITYGDTGLGTATASVLGLERKPSRKELNAFFEPFSDWESYLVVYLWRTLSC